MSNFVLEARSVVAGYVPDLPILHGVSVHVSVGEIVTIIGPNGAGKSTLIKAIAGLLNISDGEVLLDGKSITNIPAHKLAAEGVGYVPQTGNVFATLSIHENLVMGGAPLPKELATKQIEKIYSLYPVLKERMHEKAGVLSGGQRQILAVARALLTQPRLILLDEPTAALGVAQTREVLETIRQLRDTGHAVVYISHNLRDVFEVCDRITVLRQGTNVAIYKVSEVSPEEIVSAMTRGMDVDDA